MNPFVSPAERIEQLEMRLESAIATLDSHLDLIERTSAQRDRFKGMVFDAWTSARQQTKGMQRMARRIKRLRQELRVSELRTVHLAMTLKSRAEWAEPGAQQIVRAGEITASPRWLDLSE
jgi:chromosome segregation ATPase